MTRYGGAVDVRSAADLYAQGWSLRQIAAELVLTCPTNPVRWSSSPLASSSVMDSFG